MFIPVGNKKLLSKEIVKQLIDSMIGRELKPGDKIPTELELTKVFDVSRGTVREAMKTLEVFGLITINPGIGTFVKKLDLDLFLGQLTLLLFLDNKDIINLLEIRKLLEPYGAGKAAENSSGEWLKEMENQVLMMKENHNNIDEFIKHDIQFHILIHKNSGNDLLAKIIENIQILYKHQLKIAIKKPGSIESNIKFHYEIIDAIKKGNKNLAKTKMLQHIKDVEKILGLKTKK